MNEPEAREILGSTARDDNELRCWGGGDFIDWETDNDLISLDGAFSPDQLRAIAWWMDNFKED